LPQRITPIAKALYLCDGVIGFSNQKTDIMGLFNSIRPAHYPHVHGRFVAFAQLSGGLGQVPFFFEVQFAATGKVVYSTTARILTFSRRDQVQQLTVTLPNCPYSQPGVYLVELIGNGQCLADVALDLL
jgi:hypothetical protein